MSSDNCPRGILRNASQFAAAGAKEAGPPADPLMIMGLPNSSVLKAAMVRATIPPRDHPATSGACVKFILLINSIVPVASKFTLKVLLLLPFLDRPAPG